MVMSASFVAMKNACCAKANDVPPVPVIDYEKVVLCAPSGARVLVITAIAPTTGLPTSKAYNMDGSAYTTTPISDLGACDTADTESDAVVMCDGGTNTFLRWFIKRDGLLVGAAFNTTIAGAPYIPVGVVTPGLCVAANLASLVVTDGIELASGTFLAANWSSTNESSWQYTGGFKLQSVTIAVDNGGLRNSPNIVTIAFSSGRIVRLGKGEIKEFSVQQDSSNVAEFLDNAILITAQGNSSATVTWTEQQ